MGRRRKKGDPVNGWIIIDKPIGVTSTQMVGKTRWAFNAQKAGHAGTLDPLASGILPIALGEATKTVPYLVDDEKVYRFTVKWGEATETDDREGDVTDHSDHVPTDADILVGIEGFLGVTDQVPPIYSAVKVDGERAYNLARAGKNPKLAPKEIWIGSFEHLGTPDPGHSEFRVLCGKGTYIRALARDLALKLGTFAHVTALRREKVGPFDESAAISLDLLESLRDSARALEHLHPVLTALDDIPALAITREEANDLKQGRQILAVPTAITAPDGTPLHELPDQDEPIAATCMSGSDNILIAIGKLEGGNFRPVRVFNLQV